MKKINKYVIINLIFICANIFFLVLIAGRSWFSFKFPKTNAHFSDFSPCLFFFVPSYISLIGLIISEKAKTLKKTLLIITGFSFVVLLPAMFFFGAFTPFFSQTENINNYLKVDNQVEKYDYSYFPGEIPANATNIKYFYRFRNNWEIDFDIMSQWDLPENDYTMEKERISKEYPEAEIVQNRQHPDFIDYRINYQRSTGYQYEFVSFSDKTRTIRYICAGTVNNGGGSIKPYFIESDEW